MEVDEYVSSRIYKEQIITGQKSKMFIKNEAEIMSRVYCVKWAGLNFSELLFESKLNYDNYTVRSVIGLKPQEN